MRNSNKETAFKNYTKKWGLGGYMFFIYRDAIISVVPKKDVIENFQHYQHFNEIKSIHTLMRRRDNRFNIETGLGTEHLKFDSLNELIEYFFIKRLACI